MRTSASVSANAGPAEPAVEMVVVHESSRVDDQIEAEKMPEAVMLNFLPHSVPPTIWVVLAVNLSGPI